MRTTMDWHGIDLRWAYTTLLRGIHRRTGCVHRAYDVLHDALIRLALVKQHRPVEQPHAYLRTVVTHTLADHFRNEARWIELPGNDENPSDNDIAPGYAPSAEHLACLHERLLATQRLLDCLPPRCREIFWLFRVEGYTQREIAEKLGLARKTVENHIMRALVGIRSAVESFPALS